MLTEHSEPAALPAYHAIPGGSPSVHLDALRGIAAIAVLLNHWRDCLFVDYPESHHHNPLVSTAYLITGLGHQWVVVFFVLSGYLVGGSILRQLAADRWSWGDYALNRLARLYTVLIPALVLGSLIDLLGLHFLGTAGVYSGHSGAHEVTAGIAGRLTPLIGLGNLFFLQAIRVPILGSNGPLWSLSYEFWYYAAFPFMAFIFWRKLKIMPRLLSTGVLATLIIFVGKDVALLGLIWLMGTAIHRIPPIRLSTTLRRRACLATSILLTMGTLAWSKKVHFSHQGFDHFVPSDLILGAVITALVYMMLSCSQGPLAKVYTLAAQHIAKSSYTLYLVHVPAIVLLTALIGRPRWQPDVRHLMAALGLLAVVLIYAQVIYFLFERNTSSIRISLKSTLSRTFSAHSTQTVEPQIVSHLVRNTDRPV